MAGARLSKKSIRRSPVTDTRQLDYQRLEQRNLLATLIAENFQTFTGQGFTSSPTTGQLDSDDWQVAGLSDGDGTFGGEHTTGDFARGQTGASVTSGGVYAFDVGSSNIALGAQPTGADMTPGSFNLKLENTTGSSANEWMIDYDIWSLNDESRSNSLNLSYSTDNSSFNALSTADFSTPTTADSNGWTTEARSTTINVTVPSGGFIYFRWAVADAGGSGGRDQIGIDNLTVNADAVAVTTLDLRIVSYNVENNPQSAGFDGNFETIFEAIGQETFSGVTRPLDLLVLQETDPTSTNRIEGILDGLYADDYETVLSNNSSGDWFAFAYNTSTLDLLETQILSGSYTRNPFRGLFHPVGADGSSSDFYVYDVHLNAGNAATRLTEANGVRADIDTLGSDKNVLVIGDLNIDSSSEGSYAALLASGVGQVFDPISAPGNWNNNSAFKAIHTQDPSGQMDDRFDFQLTSDDVLAAGGLEFIPGTYRAFGNDGSHNFNGLITTGTGASAAVLSALANATDHLPVVADYRFDIPDSGCEATTHTLGNLRAGIAVDDAATGSGYLMYSATSVHARFTANPPFVANSDQLIAVRYSGGQWQYNDNLQWQTFSPLGGDRLLAEIDFSADTISSLEGITDHVQGIAQGFESGDLQFFANRWNGNFNLGEFEVTGTSFDACAATCDSTVSFDLGTVGSGIAVDDAATGTGYILHSATSVHTRFAANAPFVGNSDQLIAVRFSGDQWQYNDNLNWQDFDPSGGDRLLAAVNFSADTMTSLQGASGQVEGIDQGFFGGDLEFFVNQWNGGANGGEFTITGSTFDVCLTCQSTATFEIGNIRSGIAVDDAATGTGYILYSAASVHSRFAANAPFVANSDHLIAVRNFNDQWQYNDNLNWHNFTPSGSDRLLAVVDFSADTIVGLQGATGQIEGINQGFVSGDLEFFANQWSGSFNTGEFTVTGMTFDACVIDGGSSFSIGNTGLGIAVDDNATGAGYIMFSLQSVHSRFSANPPFVGTSQNLIAVRNFNSLWQYNDNNSWVTFTPDADDQLLADINFSADTVTSLQGASGQVQGIDQGYISGDLEFFANQWNGSFNLGEFEVTGTTFTA
jgi:hypothetical protein